MKRGPLFPVCRLSSVCRRLLPAALLLAAPAAAALAQENSAPNADEEFAAARTSEAAQKIDEFEGRLGHCNLTARLDNLAIHIQVAPKVKAYLVARNAAGAKVDVASWHLKSAFYYLTRERGLAAERVVLVNAGAGAGKEMQTELWVVPDGAEPPARPAVEAGEFSGLLDTYEADRETFREEVEMGWPSYAVAFEDFASKLRRQPDSQGYLVVRTPAAGSLPSAWRRIARRDEFILRNDFEVEAGRVKSIYGGPAKGDKSEVELWVLPKSAPPPAGEKEPPGARPSAATRIHGFDVYDQLDEVEAGWTVENLAELLREDKKARAVIIVRPRLLEESEGESEEAGDESNAGAEAASPVAAASDARTPAEAAELEEEEDVLGVAEGWKELLAKKYGIEPHRVLVMEGHPYTGYAGRLETWLVPAEAALPDPFEVTKDEEPAEGETETEVEIIPEGVERVPEEATPPGEFLTLEHRGVRQER